MSNPIVYLADRIDTYELSHEMATATKGQMRYALKKFEKFLGRRATLADLNVDALNGWLLDLQGAKLAKRTLRAYRGRILTLWNDALDEGLVDTSPGRLRKIKLDRHTPEAWSTSEVLQLLQRARACSGELPHSRLIVSASRFWVATINTLWDTAIRLGDLEKLRTGQVFGKNEFTIVQSKTGDSLHCRLRPETVEAIKLTYPPDRRLVFGSIITRRAFFREFRALVESAGLTTEKGGTKMLRKASATAIEAAYPGMAMRHLGHRCPDMAHRHYLDKRYIDGEKPLMPPIDPNGKEGA